MGRGDADLRASRPAAARAWLARIELPQPEVGRSRIGSTVLYVDRFGNVQLNVRREQLEEAGVVPGTKVELELAGERYYAVAARTFADARPGDLILYEDSYRNVAVAISRGNAAELLHAQPGQDLRIDVGVP